MIPLEEAQQYVLDRVPVLDASPVPLLGALGLVTAEAVASPELVPPFANTAVDGFAVMAADTAGASADARVELDVIATLPAGAAPDVPVAPGTAIRIMTGAPMPEGADAVVMVEWTEALDGGARVAIDRSVGPGDHVRHPGEDLRPGDPVFAEGVELSPGHLGVLASIGRYEVLARRRPRVAVFSTGDELVEGSRALNPGEIRDSNRYSLLALLERDGFDALDLGVIVDDESLIEEAVRKGAAECDALVTSGGVSMGDYDYVKAVLDRVGDMRWMQVAIKPAKPLAFGLVDGKPVFGLPGNPVSSMVSYELFARPGLRKMMGHSVVHRPRVSGVAVDGLRRRPDEKTHFARVKVALVDGRFELRSAGGQGSHQLTAMAAADALAVLPDGDGVGAGEAVEFMHLAAF